MWWEGNYYFLDLYIVGSPSRDPDAVQPLLYDIFLLFLRVHMTYFHVRKCVGPVEYSVDFLLDSQERESRAGKRTCDLWSVQVGWQGGPLYWTAFTVIVMDYYHYRNQQPKGIPAFETFAVTTCPQGVVSSSNIWRWYVPPSRERWWCHREVRAVTSVEESLQDRDQRFDHFFAALRDPCWQYLWNVDDWLHRREDSSRRAAPPRTLPRWPCDSFEVRECLQLDSVLPEGLKVLLAQFSPRPLTLEALYRELHYYCYSDDAVQPPWLSAGLSLTQVSSAYGMSLFVWSSLIMLAAQAVQELQEMTRSGKGERCQLVAGLSAKTKQDLEMQSTHNSWLVVQQCLTKAYPMRAINLGGKNLTFFRGLEVKSLYFSTDNDEDTTEYAESKVKRFVLIVNRGSSFVRVLGVGLIFLWFLIPFLVLLNIYGHTSLFPPLLTHETSVFFFFLWSLSAGPMNGRNLMACPPDRLTLLLETFIGVGHGCLEDKAHQFSSKRPMVRHTLCITFAMWIASRNTFSSRHRLRSYILWHRM